jgi:hypothetical protein
LDFAAEARRIAERNTALEKASEWIDSLWSDSRRCHAVVLLQDRAQHIGEAVDGCRRSLITMHYVMLPRNPLPGSFPLLLDTFRSSQRIHRLIDLNLVARANFALGWMRKWYPRLNYSSMSLSYPSGGASLRVHLENTSQLARRIIARLLREDAAFSASIITWIPWGWMTLITRCFDLIIIYIYFLPVQCESFCSQSILTLLRILMRLSRLLRTHRLK